MRKIILSLALGIPFAATAAATTAISQTATYTFESPQWVVNQSSPFLNKTPDSGWSALLANFTSGPGVPMTVRNMALSPSFSGNCLMQLGVPGDNANSSTLTVSLSAPVNSVRVDFSLFSPGHLDFSSAAGSTSQDTSPTMPVGTLNFTSPTAFTQFSLAGFNNSNGRLLFSIDNLTVSVPEPGSAALLLIGLGACLRRPAARR
jgi:hypothetical protein